MIRKCFTKASPPKTLNEISTKYYIEKLNISEIRMNISFDPLGAPDSQQKDPIWMAFVRPVAKLENCPLKFNSLSFEHEYGGVDHIASSLISSYVPQAISQIYLILGSLDVFGNPVKLVKLISEGVWDFLYLPAVGFVTSPEAFWDGIRQVFILFFIFFRNTFTFIYF
jgi:hypothetical protein